MAGGGSGQWVHAVHFAGAPACGSDGRGGAAEARGSVDASDKRLSLPSIILVFLTISESVHVTQAC